MIQYFLSMLVVLSVTQTFGAQGSNFTSIRSAKMVCYSLSPQLYPKEHNYFAFDHSKSRIWVSKVPFEDGNFLGTELQKVTYFPNIDVPRVMMFRGETTEQAQDGKTRVLVFEGLVEPQTNLVPGKLISYVSSKEQGSTGFASIKTTICKRY